MNKIIEKMTQQSEEMLNLQKEREEADKLWAQRLREAEDNRTMIAEELSKKEEEVRQAQEKYRSSLHENEMLEEKLKENMEAIQKAQDNISEREQHFYLEKQELI